MSSKDSDLRWVLWVEDGPPDGTGDSSRLTMFACTGIVDVGGAEVGRARKPRVSHVVYVKEAR